MTARLPPVLLLVSLIFMRPMLFGERWSIVASALAVLAAILSASERQSLDRPGRAALLAALGLWLWEAVLLVAHPDASLGDFGRGLVTVLITLLAAITVLRGPRNRVVFIKGLAAIVLALCASAIVTAIIWYVRQPGAGCLGLLHGAGYRQDSAGNPLPGVPIYAPFTPTYSPQTMFGVSVPRFLGIGRESGVFAAVIAWTYFMLDRIGWRRWRWKVLLVAGLLLTQSTAGFAAFLVAWVVSRFWGGRRAPDQILGYLKFVCGLGLLVVAGYLAFNAPAIGVSAKADINEASVSDRLSATLTGAQAILTYPFGMDPSQLDPHNAGINLIASVSEVGLIGALLLAAGILAPWLVSPCRREAMGPVVVLFVTVLAAQPLRYSTAFFVLALMASQSLPGQPKGPQSPLATASNTAAAMSK